MCSRRRRPRPGSTVAAIRTMTPPISSPAVASAAARRMSRTTIPTAAHPEAAGGDGMSPSGAQNMSYKSTKYRAHSATLGAPGSSSCVRSSRNPGSRHNFSAACQRSTASRFPVFRWPGTRGRRPPVGAAAQDRTSRLFQEARPGLRPRAERPNPYSTALRATGRHKAAAYGLRPDLSGSKHVSRWSAKRASLCRGSP